MRNWQNDHVVASSHRRQGRRLSPVPRVAITLAGGSLLAGGVAQLTHLPARTAQAATLAAQVGCSPATLIPPGDTANVHKGPILTVYRPPAPNPSRGASAGDPGVVAWHRPGRTEVLVHLTRGLDISGKSAGAAVRSDNGGGTFGSPFPFIGTGSLTRLSDGTFLAIRFEPSGATADHRNLSLDVKTSSDGLNWWPVSSTAFTQGKIAWGRVAGNAIQLRGGTILLPVYGRYYRSVTSSQLEPYTRAELYAGRLTSGHLDFGKRSIIAGESSTHAYNETAIAVTADPVSHQPTSLLAIMRRDAPGEMSTLVYRRSADLGRTWGALGGVRFADRPGCAVPGVDPQLLRMSNGVLVLSSGRPDNWLAISRDGTGASWTQEQVTYRNRPRQAWAAGSSGYTGITEISPGRLFLVVDNCKIPGLSHVHLTGGCYGAGYTGFQHGTAFEILRRLIDITR